MKNKSMFIPKVMFCIVLATGSKVCLAQTQSMQLPVPSENASVINFADPANPAITILPAQEFRVGGPTGPPGYPHTEIDLRDAYPNMFEAYLGQHPMYGQTVVNDADGNLLFFIVDNNIYNRFGEAMIDAC